MSKMFVSNMPAVTIAINATSMKALIAAADVGRNQTVTNISGSRSGRTYRVPGTGVTYTASAPGEYPAVRLGDLKGGIQRKVVGGEVRVGTALKHGFFLEDPNDEIAAGAHFSGSRNPARPWLKRSLDEAKPAMLAKLAERWF